MSIIDDALKKTQASLAKRKKKEIPEAHDEPQNDQAAPLPGGKIAGGAGKKIIWYRNFYAILCISVAVGALLYTMSDYYGLPGLSLNPESPDQENLPVRMIISGQPSLPVQKDAGPPGPDQPIIIRGEEKDITEHYAEGLNHYDQGNFKGAMESYRKAAGKGHAGAQFHIGVMYSEGQGVEQDYEEVVRWYRRAAVKGHAEAQNSLGIMCLQGRGVEQDNEEAVKWCRRAAEQGYPQAQYNLGTMYSKGIGTEQDNEEAAKWYHKAAEHGYAQAQTILGLMYSRGKGVERDYKEAVKWYRKAAVQGYARAQYNLGVMYTEGKGVERDYKEAVNWYHKAAGQGHEESQAMLDKIEQ